MSSPLTPNVLELALILGFALIVMLTFTIGGMITSLKARRAALELIQRELDKGRQLDPVVVERLLAPQQGTRGPRKMGPLPGVMTLALGIGVAVTGLLAVRVSPEKVQSALSSGAILICLGIGLLVSTHLTRAD